MNFDRMRVLLLERAIRGELVPQLTEDGSIEQVGDRKGLFDIPKSWGWFEFSNVVKTISSRGYQIPAKEISEKGRYPVVTQSKNSLIDGYSEEESKLVPKAFLPLLVFGDHTRFLKYVDFQFIVGADGTKLMRPKDDNLVNCSYLYYVLRALVPETKDRGYSRHFQFLKKLMIPVPPIHEQCRIVDRVEELLSEIDRAEKAYEELQTLASVLRGQILQKAIQGQLVTQLDTEPSVEMIGVAPRDVPFEIPDSWKWIRLDVMATIVRGGSPRPIKSFITEREDGLNWIKIGDAERGTARISHCAEKIVPEGLKKTRFIKRGSLLLTNSMSFGYPYILDVDGCIHDGWLAFSDFESVLNRDYLYYTLLSPYCRSVFVSKAAGAVVKNLNIDKVKEVFIPVPPVKEQARIVAKVEELLKQVDALSAG